MLGTDLELEQAFVSMLSCVNMTEDVQSMCVRMASEDAVYKAAVEAYHQGWPRSKKDDCGEYWSSRNDVLTENELLFYKGRLVVPRAARKDVLTLLHRGHVGMTTMAKRADDMVWWPSMRNEIKKWVERCSECQSSRPQQRREPMMSFTVPQAPGLMVHADYFEMGNGDYLILVDGFSGWMEVLSANNMRPSELKRLLRLYMTRNGVPKNFHSDQGSAFESTEFQEFCDRWGITRTTNSPKYPRGNGLAEAHVKKAKHILTTVANDDELAQALLALMQTPVAPGKPSPAQLHLGRNHRDEMHPQV
jgi:transposase InsO family protein